MADTYGKGPHRIVDGHAVRITDTPAPPAEPSDEALILAFKDSILGFHGVGGAKDASLHDGVKAYEALRARLASKDAENAKAQGRIAELRRLIIAWNTYFGLDADEDDMGAKKLLADTRAIIGETR
jgi:hypothetical protein